MTRPISRRNCLAAALATSMAFAAPRLAIAQAYPARPIRLTVGFAPGTGPDVVTRLLGQKLSDLMKQPFVIENRAGAGGQIAAQFVAKSIPDGYNLLIADVSAISIAPAAFTKLTYDPIRELTAVSEVVRTDFVLVVPMNSPAKNYADFVKLAAANQNRVNFGTFGAGTPGHFGAEMLAEQGGFKIEPVHFRNTGDVITALASGDVQAGLMSVALATAQLKGTKMRALATTAQTRLSMLPDVPTFKESGYPNADFSAWFCLFVPTGTPEGIVATLNAQVLAALQDADLRLRLEEAGFSIIGSSPEAAKRMIASETVKWKKVVATTGFKGD